MAIMVSQESWDKAIQHFNVYKLSKFVEIDDFTFIKLKNDIIATDDKPDNVLGQGRFSVIKKAIDRQGFYKALKIERVDKDAIYAYKQQCAKENEVLTQLGLPEYYTIERQVTLNTAAQSGAGSKSGSGSGSKSGSGAGSKSGSGAGSVKAIAVTEFYGVMPLIEGADLNYQISLHKLQSKCDLPPDQALALALQCCTQIKTLHDRHVAHHDIHTGNFMNNGDLQNPNITVHDFGKAIIVNKMDKNAVNEMDKNVANEMDKKAVVKAFNKDVQQLRSMCITEFGMGFLKAATPNPKDLTLDDLILVLKNEWLKMQPKMIPPPTPTLLPTAPVVTNVAPVVAAQPPAKTTPAPIPSLAKTTPANVQAKMAEIVKKQNR